MKKVDVFGVKIDDVNMQTVLSLIESWLKSRGKHYIVTPNPEFVMAAQEDREFMNILNKADLAIPDGAGLKLASKELKNRIAGVDLMKELISIANKKGYTIGLLGGKNMVAERLKERLLKQYPNLKITFADSGGEIDKNGEQVSKKTHNTRYIIPNTDILFVAFGQVKQEKWIYKNLQRLPVKVMMGVGGSFDYLAGEIPRAFKFMRDLGLEWLFRLIVEPQRIKRALPGPKYLWMCVFGSTKT